MKRLGDEEFLARRAKLVESWPAIGGLMLAMIAIYGAWLVVRRPALANPFFVFARLRADELPAETIPLMAAMLPVFVLLCLCLVAVLVMFAFASFANERRYLAIIRRRPETPPGEDR